MRNDEVTEALAALLVGCRLKVTQINAPREVRRFERRAEGVYDTDEGFIGIRLNKDVSPEYGLLKKRRIIHFCPATKIWRGVDDDKSFHAIFQVEVVGVRYLHRCKEFERFGIAVSGHDVRVIMFERLFEKFGLPVVYGDHKKPVMEIIGGELRTSAIAFLDHRDVKLTEKEQYVIEKFLGPGMPNRTRGGINEP